jgi:hypothetical protein
VLLPWLVRIAWLSLPLTAGGVLADGFDGRSSAVQLTFAVLAWAVWGAVVLAVLLPRPVGLTALRMAATGALALSVWGAADVGSGTDTVLAALVGVPFVLALLPEVGGWFVNGAAYGDERRYLLRAPGALLLGPIPLAVAVAVAGVLAGPLLLAAEQWVLGGIVLVVGLVAARVCLRALHQLTLRWAVLVPAGLVLKDHVTLVDPILFKRTIVEVLRPAPAGTDSLDLTARAPGLAVELVLKESEPVLLVMPGREPPKPGHTARLLFTPTRPGALLAEAGTRRIPLG